VVVVGGLTANSDAALHAGRYAAHGLVADALLCRVMYESAGHVMHTRSDVTVGGEPSYSDALQLAITPHVRSDEVVAATIWNSVPRAHVVTGSQTALERLDRNVPTGHAEQRRSDVVVGGVDSSNPTPHSVVSRHPVASDVAVAGIDEYWCAGHVDSAVHPTSEVVVASVERYDVRGSHGVTAVHAVFPASGLNDTPTAHVTHWRSAEAVGPLVSPTPAEQVEMATHARSDVADGAAASYCADPHGKRTSAHCRSVVAVAAIATN
jgi:hypothetical protein